jgi:ParB-like chromosome segregation protein Spo0J
MDERDLVYVQGILLQARIEMEGMIAENKQREHLGVSMAYVEKDFQALIEKYGVHHNALITGLYR